MVETTINVRCVECDKTMSLTRDKVTLARYDTGPRYAFVCVHCSAMCSKPADPATLSLLSQVGVHARLPIPRPTIDGHPPRGDVITLDDAIDLGLWLATL